MLNLYNTNGLIFWDEQQINLRNQIEQNVLTNLKRTLKSLNQAFDLFRVEAPILTPREYINKNYTNEDIFIIQNDLVLRPETTMGSYEYAKLLLNHQQNFKPKLPFVVWQHGKSFRNEQDQVTKNMRLKEFHQLEFQILFSPTTSNDYYIKIIENVKSILTHFVGECRLEPSDRLPDYSLETTDVICSKTNMEICSISRRKDLEGVNNIEVAIGTDRIIFNNK